MMRVAQRRRVAIIIGTFPLLNPDGFRTRGAANVPRLNDVIRQEAKKKGVPVADHEKASGDDLRGQGPDGLHPNAIGYQIMAETWFAVIRQLVAGSET
ncbi:MAG: SGNH/GDSL hydrolase family protein, partial [Acidobacteriota bacterium]